MVVRAGSAVFAPAQHIAICTAHALHARRVRWAAPCCNVAQLIVASSNLSHVIRAATPLMLDDMYVGRAAIHRGGASWQLDGSHPLPQAVPRYNIFSWCFTACVETAWLPAISTVGMYTSQGG